MLAVSLVFFIALAALFCVYSMPAAAAAAVAVVVVVAVATVAVDAATACINQSFPEPEGQSDSPLVEKPPSG